MFLILWWYLNLDLFSFIRTDLSARTQIGIFLFTGMNSITYRNNVNIASGPKLYSFKDVQCHCTYNSCWIVITNQVYDVTNFLEEVSGHVDKI